jgi:hypothetical protein
MNLATMMNVAVTTNVATMMNVVAMPPPMIPFPNPTNDIMFAGLFGLSNKEKVKFRREQAKYLRKKNNLVVIHANNQDLFIGKGGMSILQMTPERKPAIGICDNMGPAVNLQEYISVTPDTPPYKNRPYKYGCITDASGVGAATIVYVLTLQ